MTSLLVFPGLRQETLLSIRGRLERDINAGRDPEGQNFYDLIPGAVPSDLLMTAALEFERMWDFASIDVPAASLVEFAWGIYLDAHGQTIEVARDPAVKSQGNLVFTAPEGTIIPIGTEAATVQVDAEEEPISFRTTQSGTVGVSGEITLTAEAVEPGSAGNVTSGAVTELQTGIPNTTVTNPEAFTDGADLESDDSYREKLKLEYSAEHGGGSVDDLRAWSLSYPGVGFVRVVPLWLGPGTVRVIATDSENNPISNATKEGLQADLDPPSAKTTVSTAVTLPAAVIKGVSTAGFEETGKILVGNNVVTYTSIAGNEFKGCTGGEGLQAIGTRIWQQGQGRGQAPVGIMVTVDTAAILAANVELHCELEEGFTYEGTEGTVALKAAISEALAEYINSLQPGGETASTLVSSGKVLRNEIVRAVLGVDGVYDVTLVKINGAEANLTVGSLQVPELGTVTLT